MCGKWRMDMARSRIEIQNLAEKILEEAGIQPCFKPMISKIVASQGLRVAPALNLQDSVFSTLLLHDVEGDKVASRMNSVISVNASKTDKEQRFAVVYQVAFYALYKDVEGQQESRLTATEIYREDDDSLRLACALLMNDELFLDKFRKAVKGIPNRVAVCKNLAAQFGVPQYAVERRAKDLDLQI